MLVNEGRIFEAKVMTAQLSVADVSMGLFVAAHTFVATDTLGSITVAVTAGLTLATAAGWSVPALQPDGRALSQAGTWTFTNGGGVSVTIYGVYYMANGGTVFLGGVAFGTPILLAPGQSLLLVPSLSDMTG